MDEYRNWTPEPIPDGWVVLDEAARIAIRDELNKEVAASHPLSGLTLTPVAKCVGCDEMLVFVEDETRWALVHVTHAGGPEQPPWPRTRLFGGKIPMDAMNGHAEHVSPQ